MLAGLWTAGSCMLAAARRLRLPPPPARSLTRPRNAARIGHSSFGNVSNVMIKANELENATQVREEGCGGRVAADAATGGLHTAWQPVRPARPISPTATHRSHPLSCFAPPHADLRRLHVSLHGARQGGGPHRRGPQQVRGGAGGGGWPACKPCLLLLPLAPGCWRRPVLCGVQSGRAYQPPPPPPLPNNNTNNNTNAAAGTSRRSRPSSTASSIGSWRLTTPSW